jgi:serine/threonine protein kinase
MAPEVLERGELSKAADVYSFGVVLWQVRRASQAASFQLHSAGPPMRPQRGPAIFPSPVETCSQMGPQLVVLQRQTVFAPHLVPCSMQTQDLIPNISILFTFLLSRAPKSRRCAPAAACGRA